VKRERYALVRLDAFQGQFWGVVVAAGSELAVEAARRLLIPLNGVDCAVREEHLVPR
jgi:hypothetical protein